MSDEKQDVERFAVKDMAGKYLEQQEHMRLAFEEKQERKRQEFETRLEKQKALRLADAHHYRYCCCGNGVDEELTLTSQ